MQTCFFFFVPLVLDGSGGSIDAVGFFVHFVTIDQSLWVVHVAEVLFDHLREQMRLNQLLRFLGDSEDPLTD